MQTTRQARVPYLIEEDNGFQTIDEEEDEESYMDNSPAFAIPGWAAMDDPIETLIDAAGGSSSTCGPTLHERSVAGCVGALLPPRTNTFTHTHAHNGSIPFYGKTFSYATELN